MNDKIRKDKIMELNRTQHTRVEAPVVEFPEPGVAVGNPVTFSGTGEPGWHVIVYNVPIDGTDILVATVGEDGKWSGQPDADLKIGNHSAFALQTYNRERSPWSPIFDFNVES